MWRVLCEMGLDHKWITLLKVLYSGNRTKLKYGDHTSEWVTTTVGLRQGCPLSPILFMLYINALEGRLLKSGAGFRVRTQGDFWNTREKKYFLIPGLLFADDLVLMSQDYSELQKLLDTTSRFGDEMDLTFNPRKS